MENSKLQHAADPIASVLNLALSMVPDRREDKELTVSQAPEAIKSNWGFCVLLKPN